MKTKDIVLVGLFAALTAVGAAFSIPVGPAPITLQSFFVVLSGLLLGPKLGALSQLVYILIGVIGIPVFSGFKGGLQVVLGPTFGFLIGFVVGSYVIGKIAYMGNTFSKKRIWIAAFIGSIIFYLIGVPYMYMIINVYMGKSMTLLDAFKKGFFIFIPGDTLKFILSSMIATRVVPLLNKNLKKEVI